MTEKMQNQPMQPSQPWMASVLTLFPDMFPGPLAQSLAGKALAAGLWSLHVTDIRPFGVGVHNKVDDPPFGGGPGMVMRPDVMAAALASASDGLSKDMAKIYLSPRGKRLDQPLVKELAAGPGVLLVCGRYEGLDQRVIDAAGLTEISIGDYVLSGGEMAAQVLIDAVVRLLDGVMGNPMAHQQDSFENGLLEHPLYTHPRDWGGNVVPEILLSGDHGRIAKWRQEAAMALTQKRRPDLWEEWLKSEAKEDQSKGKKLTK